MPKIPQEQKTKASFPGKFFKIDCYPGAVPSEGTADRVFGEVYEIIEPESVLPLLDKYEECGPGFEAPTEYVRERRSVTLTDRRTLTSWIYIYNRPTEGLQQIASGDFLKPGSISTVRSYASAIGLATFPGVQALVQVSGFKN